MEKEKGVSNLIELGGHIVLVGFRELDASSLVVLKKVIGNYTRKFSDRCKGFESITITMKPIHEVGDSKKYEINVKVMDCGKPLNTEITDKNLFVAVDNALKKIEKMI